jgi:hypothetical protein
MGNCCGRSEMKDIVEESFNSLKLRNMDYLQLLVVFDKHTEKTLIKPQILKSEKLLAAFEESQKYMQEETIKKVIETEFYNPKDELDSSYRKSQEFFFKYCIDYSKNNKYLFMVMVFSLLKPCSNQDEYFLELLLKNKKHITYKDFENGITDYIYFTLRYTNQAVIDSLDPKYLQEIAELESQIKEQFRKENVEKFVECLFSDFYLKSSQEAKNDSNTLIITKIDVQRFFSKYDESIYKLENMRSIFLKGYDNYLSNFN